MSQLNGKGPEGKGSGTGRSLGKCKKDSPKEDIKILGTGQALRRKTGGGKGHGKRLRSGLN